MADDLLGKMPLAQRIRFNLTCKAVAKAVDRGYTSGDPELLLALLQHAAENAGRRAVSALCYADLDRYERHLIELGPHGRSRTQDDDLRLIGKAREYADTGEWPGGAP